MDQTLQRKTGLSWRQALPALGLLLAAILLLYRETAMSMVVI